MTLLGRDRSQTFLGRCPHHRGRSSTKGEMSRPERLRHAEDNVRKLVAGPSTDVPI